MKSRPSPSASAGPDAQRAPDSRYLSFLSSRCAKQWQRIGVKRRAGVAVPLFSIYSSKSAGVGEIPDLALLLDWCKEAGLSLIQLLPMNDVGYDFRPYDAQSSFALEPMHLSLETLAETDVTSFKTEIQALRKRFPVKKALLDCGIKLAKLELLWKIFQKLPAEPSAAFRRFVSANAFWIDDYALYKVIKDENQQRNWENWEVGQRNRRPEVLSALQKSHAPRIRFYQWLQWQLFEQFKSVKELAASAGVVIMGDLPFLVSRDSADVWSHQDFFQLDHVSGAPPDMYQARGQRWGMPPYNWGNILRQGGDYVVQKIRYAQNFYDLFRIDHVVGMFRLWVIPDSEPLENRGLNGHFDPGDESLWEEHGRRLLQLMIENTDMLPCAEDLGVVPDSAVRVLEQYGIPGMDVQRWKKDWGKSYDFTPAEQYRRNSISTISSHDTSSLLGWWEFEAGTVDQELFHRKCDSRGIAFDEIKSDLFDLEKSSYGRLRWRARVTRETLLGVLKRSEPEVSDLVDLYLGSCQEKEKFWRYLGLPGSPAEKADPEFVRSSLAKAGSADSVFSVQLMQDWLSLDASWKVDPWKYRINFPGIMSEENWRLLLPLSLEQIGKCRITADILKINRETGRL